MTQDEFIVIWKNLLPGLRIFILKMTSYSKEDAEDLIQETYIKAHSGLHTYDKKFSAKTWVYSIARNKFSDDYRKKRIRYDVNNRIPETDNPLKEFVFDSNLSVGNFVLKDIADAVDQLDPKERVLFQMLIEGYKYDEIAEKCKQPIGTVKARIFAARRKLWDTLKDYEDVSSCR